MQDEQEQEQKMNGEEQKEEQSMEKPVEEPEKEPEKEHEAVGPGGECWCGWKFGDPVKGISPHIVSFGALRNEPEPVVEPPKVQVKESDPKACEPVALGVKCQKCGWSSTDPATSGNPHPVLL